MTGEFSFVSVSQTCMADYADFVYGGSQPPVARGGERHTSESTSRKGASLGLLILQGYLPYCQSTLSWVFITGSDTRRHSKLHTFKTFGILQKLCLGNSSHPPLSALFLFPLRLVQSFQSKFPQILGPPSSKSYTMHTPLLYANSKI